MPKRATKRTTLGPSQKQGLGLLLAGSIFILVFGIWRWHQSRILSFNQQFAAKDVSGPRPTRISIPKVNLNLEVSEATITDGTWEVSPSGASHWDNSANPGQDDNIVIYGHNKRNLFGPIRWLELNDEVVLTDEQGKEYRYQIVQTVTVSPDEVDYLLPTAEETLTFYTCTGFWDSQRYIVIAKPI